MRDCTKQPLDLSLAPVRSLPRRMQGKVTEARAILAPARAWFTEGLDTRDLVDADALLSELEVGHRPSPRSGAEIAPRPGGH